ncbi:hypothetical protein [Staphylococcus chromogenes]|uniref:hypothetical protein n=1 Tax=Staphylococcus chromogenes TaxID=46126 RepID=UPI002884551C|nr:hypothetical protein [Staphylococcus chromogenes]MDT0700358.1 hypothetical protein [Staphylococcus chromogenes]
MSAFGLIGAIVLVFLLPQAIKIARILHLKHLGVKYVGNGKYEQIEDKKYKWYQWLR